MNKDTADPDQQEIVVECGECRRVLDESPSATAGERPPCPHCGSLTRHIQVHIESTVYARSDLAAKARRDGEKQPFLEQKVGDDFHQATGEWRHREMILDRENDRYQKVITDRNTGEELYRKEEPLSQHRGRGTAKKGKA